MTYTIPIIIAGSLFSLFAHFPVDYIAQWIDKTGFSMYFTQVYQATFDVIAFWIVFAIAYAYAKEENIDASASRHDSLVCLPTTYSAT